jgi:hypothetical protein
MNDTICKCGHDKSAHSYWPSDGVEKMKLPRNCRKCGCPGMDAPNRETTTSPELVERIGAIKLRTSLATKGPWEAPLKDLGAIPSFRDLDFYFDHSFEAYPPLGESGPVFVAHSKEDADFLANSRSDIEWLISEHATLTEQVRELTAEVERLRGEVAEYEAKERRQLEIATAEIESDDTDYDDPDRYMRTG